MFSCEYCENFKNTYFEEHLRTAASECSISGYRNEVLVIDDLKFLVIGYKFYGFIKTFRKLLVGNNTFLYDQ